MTVPRSAARNFAKQHRIVRRDKLAGCRRKIKSPARRREYVTLESGKHIARHWLLPSSRFSALHDLTTTRVLFSSHLFFRALQKLIAEDVVAYLYIALSKSPMMSDVHSRAVAFVSAPSRSFD